MKLSHPKYLKSLLFPKLDSDMAQKCNSQREISVGKEIQTAFKVIVYVFRFIDTNFSFIQKTPTS